MTTREREALEHARRVVKRYLRRKSLGYIQCDRLLVLLDAIEAELGLR